MAEQTTFHKFSNEMFFVFLFFPYECYAVVLDVQIWRTEQDVTMADFKTLRKNFGRQQTIQLKQLNSYACHTFENGIDGIQITKMGNPIGWNAKLEIPLI